MVRSGADAWLPTAVDDEGVTIDPGHTMQIVYAEMLRQICSDYSSLPNVRRLTRSEIRFFYDGLRPSLRQATKPGK